MILGCGIKLSCISIFANRCDEGADSDCLLIFLKLPLLNPPVEGERTCTGEPLTEWDRPNTWSLRIFIHRNWKLDKDKKNRNVKDQHQNQI